MLKKEIRYKRRKCDAKKDVAFASYLSLNNAASLLADKNSFSGIDVALYRTYRLIRCEIRELFTIKKHKQFPKMY